MRFYPDIAAARAAAILSDLLILLLLAALAGFLAFEVSGRLALACVYAVAGGGRAG